MARTVPLKLNYASRSGLVKGPQYTLHEDPPWLQTQQQTAASPPAEPRPSSTYSADLDDAALVTDPVSPLAMASSGALAPHQEIVETGTQPKTSRMPIFKQMRSMLNSARSPTSNNPLKWDEYSGEPSENGKERLGVKPSTYKSPYEGILKPRRQSPQEVDDPESPRMGSTRKFTPMLTEEHVDSPVIEDPPPHQRTSPPVPTEQHAPFAMNENLESPQVADHNARRLSPAGLSDHQARAISPVSALVEEDVNTLEQRNSGSAISPPNSRSVSPILSYDQLQHAQRNSSSMQRPRTEGGAIKRKPLAPASPTQQDTFPASTEIRIMPNSSHGAPSQSDDPGSRFSWTTAAQSDANRKSTDTRYSKPPRTADDSDRQYNSHFSWSTVASGPAMAGVMREQTPPPSPPPVPLQYLEPPVYGTPPTQSILSRHRPLKRIDKPEWAPPAPPTSHYTFTPRALTPKVYRIQDDYAVSTTPTAEGKKRLPLPPLFTEKSLTHLEGLLTREKNIILQRRNIERSILDLEKVEKASPLEVSFATVREARKKLDERRGVLDEVRREEMDIGIRIARARRKEDFGDGEGTLWVRRVTG